jgi:predicted CoA-binding protein
MMDPVEQQLTKSKVIAVVGLSPRPERDSYDVARYLQGQGYRIIPVNPTVAEVLGEKSYPDLKSIPEPIDMVDIFRRSAMVPPVVDEALEVGVKYIWMQNGVIHEEAARKAEEAGILVVMNNCAMREHRRRYGGLPAHQRPPYVSRYQGVPCCCVVSPKLAQELWTLSLSLRARFREKQSGEVAWH